MTLSDYMPHDVEGEPEPAPDVTAYMAELVHAQTQARKQSTVAMSVIGVLVLAAVALCAVIALRAQNNAQTSSDRVGNLVGEAIKLRDTIDDLQHRIDATAAVDSKIAQCETKLAAKVRDTTRDYNAAEGDLIVALRPAAQGIPDQQDTVDLAIRKLAVKLDAYRAATEKSSTWNVLTDAEKTAVPCPV